MYSIPLKLLVSGEFQKVSLGGTGIAARNACVSTVCKSGRFARWKVLNKTKHPVRVQDTTTGRTCVSCGKSGIGLSAFAVLTMQARERDRFFFP